MSTPQDAYLLRSLTRDLILTGRLWRKIARRTAAQHGVSEAATAPLIWIERLGENVHQNALAEAIGIEGASLVRLINELQASGLATRAPDPSDRRANVINLTDRGREVVHEVNDALTALRRDVFRDISHADVEAALRVCAAVKLAAAGLSDKTP